MLLNSFSHIPSVGAATEKRIWECGISTMDDFLQTPPAFLSQKKKSLITDLIYESKERLAKRDVNYFFENLSTKEQWRIFPEFRDSTVYLDIETTGLDMYSDIITTIAMYDGRNVRYYVNGKNLKDFVDDIRKYKVIVTYNGKSFDIPFIENYFGISIPHAHLDLRFILKSLGYSGGLKSCERQLGFRRAGDLDGMDGYIAVLLWSAYCQNKEQKILETLLAYNIEDVFSLECLMVEAFNRKLGCMPYPTETLNNPVMPDNPFSVDPEVIKKIRSQFYFYRYY